MGTRSKKKLIGALLELIKGAKGFKPEEKPALIKHVKALDHAVSTRNVDGVTASVEDLLRDLLKGHDGD